MLNLERMHVAWETLCRVERLRFGDHAYLPTFEKFIEFGFKVDERDPGRPVVGMWRGEVVQLGGDGTMFWPNLNQMWSTETVRFKEHPNAAPVNHPAS